MDLLEEIKADKSDRLDQLGMLVSSICAIHCIATPFVVFALPFLSHSFHHPLFHIVIALLVVPMGLWAFIRGYKRHGKKHILVLGSLGLIIITSGALLPHEVIHFLGHTTITVIGSVCLIFAHWLNRKSCVCH